MAIIDEVRPLRSMWGGFRQARVLMTANNLAIFEHTKTAKSAALVARAMRADKRAVEILLDALTGMGLIVKKSGKYKNSELSAKFLVSGQPYYQGDIIRHADNLWSNWSGLDEVVRTGRPFHVAHDHDAFIMGMHNMAIFKAAGVLNEIGTSGVKTALDLGGGPGTYSIEMARRGIKATLLDLPETVRIARKVIAKSKAKIKFIEGDFLSDDIGKGYDLILISQILHAYSEKENITLLKKSRAALNPGGRVAIQEFFIAPDRTTPPESALFSVNMLVNTEGGRCYAPSEMKKWLKAAGFKGIEEKQIVETVLVQGRV